MTNAAGDDASGNDTLCDAILCETNEHVESNACVACPEDGLGNITQVKGGYNGCALLTNYLQCWGNNYYGNMGDGSTESTDGLPVTPSGISSGVTAFAASGRLSCAVWLGDVCCWGDNYFHEIGPNCSTERCRTPSRVTTSSAIAEVATGGSTACMIHASSRSVMCWGSNRDRDSWLIGGLLGDLTTDSSASPVTAWSSSDGAAQMAMGSAHACLVTQSNRVYCWGDNNGGQLGPASTLYTNSATPLEVSL